MKRTYYLIAAIVAILLISIGMISKFGLLNSTPAQQTKIDGFNLVAPSQKFPIDSLKSVQNVGAEWIAIVPYAFCDPEVGKVVFGNGKQWWGETPTGVEATIEMAHSLGLKVMLKPHLWVKGQGWAGDLDFDTEAKWLLWETEYSNYLQTYAQLAAKHNVGMLCIGTEIRNSTKNRPHYWEATIIRTKAVYAGLITYAANWDEYEQITFWDQLDMIGIDAYFPLSLAKTPHQTELRKAWQKPKGNMQRISEQFNKPILFTEYGYESIDYAAMGHWMVDKDSLSVNLSAQSTAYEALYQEFRAADWWAGGFIWKWHLTLPYGREGLQKAYTPQQKPALEIIKKYFMD